MSKLVREVGNWVIGERFWDRDGEINNLIELLDEGANILITGQRRMGKTSIIRELGSRLQEKYVCLQIDIEKYTTPADVITDLCLAIRPHLSLWNKTKDIFRNVANTAADSIDSLKIDDLSISLRHSLSSNWRERGERIIDGLAESEKPVLIFIDEFPLFIHRLLKGHDYEMTAERIHATDEFVSWIRALTIKHRGKLRFILTGSIGLEPILRQARLSSGITTFTAFEVNPWDDETAIGCIKALANNYKVQFESGSIELMVELLGCCIPHHVQLFFSCIYDDCKRRDDMKCNPADVQRLFNTSMLSARGHAELSTYEERLKTVLGPKSMPLALEILTETAVTGKLSIQAANILYDFSGLENSDRNEVLRETLGILEHDGYIKKDKDEYVFVSKLIKDWWQARFGFQFEPALKRKM